MRPQVALINLALMVAVLLGTTFVTPSSTLAAPSAPTPTFPPDGLRLDGFETTLRWTYDAPRAVTQVHLQVLPFNNDGAGINVILNASCCTDNAFRVPPPPEWYGLLPDMTYVWAIRATDVLRSIDAQDTAWGPWSPAVSFRTPVVSSDDAYPAQPYNGADTSDTPTLQWRSLDPNVFYFEFQLSADPKFNTDPGTATAAVYWNLIHGGTTNLPNSYTVPAASRLPRANTYSWRVRPRIQGDGRPMPWSESWQINVP